MRQAENEQDILVWLREEDLTPVSITKISKKNLETRRTTQKKRIKSADMAAVCWQLTTMVSGGVPLIQALETLSEDIENIQLQKTLEKILEKMKQDQQTENAACLWLAERQTEADSLERQFMELWRCMTPDWFHEHLADCLKTFFQSDEKKDCNGCGKS